MDSDSEPDDLLAEDQGVFDDFTVASSWERLISDIEATCRMWQIGYTSDYLAIGAETVDGHDMLRQVHTDLAYGTKSYRLVLFFEANRSGGGGTSLDWRPDSHQLQLCFGVQDFLVISPVSLSGVILDAPEATFLLSAVAIALSNCGSTWPAFVPVHDPTRKAYKGIQGMKGPYCRSFESDRIGSQVPVKLMHLEGLYDLFITKLEFSIPPSASGYDGKVRFTMRLTYRTSMPGFEVVEMEHIASPSARPLDDYEGEMVPKVQWDEGYPWAEWYSVEDPIKGFELIATWADRTVESSLDMAEYENVSTLEADKWFLAPIMTHSSDEIAHDEQVSFASRMQNLLLAFSHSKEAKFIDDFLTEESPAIQKITSSIAVPPPGVLDRVLKDLFRNGALATSFGSDDGGHEKFQAIKGAPTGSLFSQFCLHALWFGSCNIRAISILWIEFVREVSWCWEELQPLPRMSPNDNINFSTCLIHQKLQLLAACIMRKGAEQKIQSSKGSNNGDEEETQEREPDEQESQPHTPVKGPMMLLKSYEKLCIPVIQEPPIMTEDMLLEHEHAMVALNDSPSAKLALKRLQTNILSADMAAFKTANPTAVFEDFIRWHSPRDWIEEDVYEDSLDAFNDSDSNGVSMHSSYPVKGKLSERMSHPENMWVKLWESVEPLPRSKQKPLFDYTREGEKVIHYLETLRPCQLLSQMICTAFSYVADILFRTEVGRPKDLKVEIDQLYATIVSILSPLREIKLSSTEVAENIEEWYGDIMDLCLLLEKAEKHVIMAASFHQKLRSTPRLFSAFFSSYAKLEKQRKSTAEVSLRQIVAVPERGAVAGALFSHIDVHQASKNSLRMGNFLNGHEPFVREIIFAHYDLYWEGQRERYRSDEASSNTQDRVLSQRMYIQGTANDLQLAHSVVSND